MKETKSVDLEESCILRLFVVLLGCVFPRDPEHTFVLILPAQSFIFPTLNLSYQPLFQVQLGSFFHLQHITLSYRNKTPVENVRKACARWLEPQFYHVPTLQTEKYQYFLFWCRPHFWYDFNHKSLQKPNNTKKCIKWYRQRYLNANLNAEVVSKIKCALEAKAKALCSFDTFGFLLLAELQRKFNHFQVRCMREGDKREGHWGNNNLKKEKRKKEVRLSLCVSPCSAETTLLFT